MKTYILRIYRHGPQELVGILETIPGGRFQSFASAQELSLLLQWLPDIDTANENGIDFEANRTEKDDGETNHK